MVFSNKAKKTSEIRVTRKILNRATGNYFFNLFSRDILFSSLVSFVFCFFCIFVFFYLFVFLKLKIYILIQIRLCGRVSDKTFFTRPISGNNTTFFWPKNSTFQIFSNQPQIAYYNGWIQ